MLFLFKHVYINHNLQVIRWISCHVWCWVETEIFVPPSCGHIGVKVLTLSEAPPMTVPPAQRSARNTETTNKWMKFGISYGISCKFPQSNEKQMDRVDRNKWHWNEATTSFQMIMPGRNEYQNMTPPTIKIHWPSVKVVGREIVTS